MADKSLKGHGLGSKSLADSQGVELAARQEISFDCPNGHHFTLTFAMEASTSLMMGWKLPAVKSSIAETAPRRRSS